MSFLNHLISTRISFSMISSVYFLSLYDNIDDICQVNCYYFTYKEDNYCETLIVKNVRQCSPLGNRFPTVDHFVSDLTQYRKQINI